MFRSGRLSETVMVRKSGLETKMIDDRAIMAKSFSDTLDLVELLLSGEFDPVDTERARNIVARFRKLLARSDVAHQQTPGA